MSGRHATRNIVVLGLVALAASVGLTSYAQRTAARESAAEQATAQAMLVAMLNQEGGLRGFALSGRDDFLDPYHAGERAYQRAVATARKQVTGHREAALALEVSDRASRRWKRTAVDAIPAIRAGRRERAFNLTTMIERKALMDRFREDNADYAAVARRRGAALENRAGIMTVLVVGIVGSLFGILGLMSARHSRNTRAAARTARIAYEARQRDLNLGLQVTESEEEAHTFLKRHLEHAVAGSEVVVLKRNNSANRLLPGTPLGPDSRLQGAFQDADPRSCLAIRLAQRRSQSPGAAASILECGICGRLETDTTCSPLLVGGEVIGSVLVGHPGPLDERGEHTIEESVKQAAPVLANLRNLQIAETRAATDGLTGLPNRRAFEENVKRMVAHANRAMSPLAAVAFDLDHFKQINDVYGHGRGDEVLAEVGKLLSRTLRDSDFAARTGGEEFMLLLPDTGRDGALIISERVRAGVAALDFAAMGREVTGSLGVAVLPDDAIDAPTLVRAADRMLYLAKENGRDRVEITELVLGVSPDA